MTTKHLNEEEIQQFALGVLGEPFAIGHIEQCAHCQQQVELYRVIFSEVKIAGKPAFNFDLATSVLEQLPAPVTIPERFPVLLAVISSAVFLIGLCAVYWDYLVDLFSGSRALIKFSIAAVVLSVLLWQAIDLIKQYQKKMQALDFY